MKLTRWALVLMIAGLVLFGVQAMIWRSTANGRTETDVENRTGHRRPTEVPILAGTALLLIAGTILCIPRDPD
jgi:heme/copper-type cytochrome/quinol oxidase subunit 2